MQLLEAQPQLLLRPPRRPLMTRKDQSMDLLTHPLSDYLLPRRHPLRDHPLYKVRMILIMKFYILFAVCILMSRIVF